MSELQNLPDTEGIKPHRIVKATELGIRGTVMEEVIRNKRCIICGDQAEMEIWIYAKEGQESTNRVEKTNSACSEECAMMIALRS